MWLKVHPQSDGNDDAQEVMEGLCSWGRWVPPGMSLSLADHHQPVREVRKHRSCSQMKEHASHIKGNFWGWYGDTLSICCQIMVAVKWVTWFTRRKTFENFPPQVGGSEGLVPPHLTAEDLIGHYRWHGFSHFTCLQISVLFISIDQLTLLKTIYNMHSKYLKHKVTAKKSSRDILSFELILNCDDTHSLP